MLVVAHRAGNDLSLLVAAAALGADVVEADVHLHRARLELRHAKSFGTPWLYDRGRLLPRDAERLRLDALLDVLPARTTVMLDLKGAGRVGSRVATAVHERAPERPVWVCARWWPSLLPFRDLPWARVLLSARNRAELARLRRRAADRPGADFGCSVHLSLLRPDVVAELRQRGLLVLTWPVEDVAALRRATDVGVDGVITGDLDVVRAVAHPPV